MKQLNLTLAALLALTLTACHPFVPLAKMGTTSESSAQTAPVSVSIGGFMPMVAESSFGVQALPTYDIKFAHVTITGHGIDDPLDTVVPITAGKGSFEFDRVPLGKNRIFTAYGLSENDKNARVKGAVLRRVYTINPLDNHVDLEWWWTPAGEVFHALYEYDIEKAAEVPAPTFATTVKEPEVQNLVNAMAAIPPNKHRSLVDGTKIASQIILNNGTVPAPDWDAFGRPTVTVKLTVVGLPNGEKFDAWVDDPGSPFLSDRSPIVGGNEIANVRPGEWNLHVVTETYGHVIERITLPADSMTHAFQIDFAGTADGNVDFGNPFKDKAANYPYDHDRAKAGVDYEFSIL